MCRWRRQPREGRILLCESPLPEQAETWGPQSSAISSANSNQSPDPWNWWASAGGFRTPHGRRTGAWNGTPWTSAPTPTSRGSATALAGVDAVVHLAWQLQPNRDLDQLFRTNVTGTANVLEAAGQSGVGHIVCASSVGAYSRAPKDRRTDESWPATGIPGSHYSRHKAEQETPA